MGQFVSQDGRASVEFGSIGKLKSYPIVEPQFLCPATCILRATGHRCFRGIRVAIDFTTKMNVRSVPFVVAGLLMFTGAVSAQDRTRTSHTWTQNLYVNVDGGVMFQPNATMDISASNGGSSSSASGDSKFDTGIRGDVKLGYNLNRSWAMEFDTGALWNSSQNRLLTGNADTYTVPFLANVIYKIPLKGSWSAYAGAGAGGAATIFSYYSTTFDPTDYTFVFAYQAEVGLQYELNQNASFGISYKFMGMTDPTWKFTQTFSGGIPPPTDYQFKEKGFYTHAVVISFTWTF